MSAAFATLVKNVRSCSTEEKLELKSVLERALIEERRREIKANGRRSMEEFKRGKLKFSSSISELKKSPADCPKLHSVPRSRVRSKNALKAVSRWRKNFGSGWKFAVRIHSMRGCGQIGRGVV